MSFAKLDSGIVNSTLWVQPDDVLRVWIWMLSQANAQGVVRTAAPALALICMKSVDRIREIVALLEAPDPDSRSENDDGRRIRKIEGGWQIINYGRYRDNRDEDATRQRKREWDRANRPSGHSRVNKSDEIPTQSDQSDAVRRSPTQAEAEAEADITTSLRSVVSAPKREPSPTRVGTRLPDDWVPDPDLIAWARFERPDLQIGTEIDAFSDYWRSKPGKDGRKTDWSATFRNWIRKAHSRPPHRVGPAQGVKSKTLTAIETLQRMKTDGQPATVASQRDSGRPEQAALPGPGSHAGS